jgi:hypothetical protein
MSLGKTRVQNVKVKYIRRDFGNPDMNLKDWMALPQNVYVGRKKVVFVPSENGGKERWPPQDSPLANPYKVGRDGTREEVIALYRDHLLAQIAQGIVRIDTLKSLKGKNLGCWCAPEPYHADVIAEIVERMDILN